jgi:hypothetical protein
MTRDGTAEQGAEPAAALLAAAQAAFARGALGAARDLYARVLERIAQNIRRFYISFDYLAPEVIGNETGDPEITAVVARFAAMGAPWTY